MIAVSHWLDAEMFGACEAVRREHIERIEACGVPRAAIAHLGQYQAQFGVARIRVTPGGLFEPDPDGRFVVVMPVIEPNIEFGTTGIIDLIAFHTSDPRTHWQRTGEGVALGLGQLEYDEPLRVVRTPLEWLAHKGEALMILDWQARSLFDALRRGPPLMVSDDTIRRRLSRAMMRSVSLPSIDISDVG